MNTFPVSGFQKKNFVLECSLIAPFLLRLLAKRIDFILRAEHVGDLGEGGKSSCRGKFNQSLQLVNPVNRCLEARSLVS